MQQTNTILKGDNGSIIIVALIMLALLTIIGLSSSHTSIMESHIAANEQLHNIVFYKADGGAETGMVLIEDGIEVRGWNDNETYGEAAIINGNFILNTESNTPNPIPTDTNSRCQYSWKLHERRGAYQSKSTQQRYPLNRQCRYDCLRIRGQGKGGRSLADVRCSLPAYWRQKHESQNLPALATCSVGPDINCHLRFL